MLERKLTQVGGSKPKQTRRFPAWQITGMSSLVPQQPIASAFRSREEVRWQSSVWHIRRPEFNQINTEHEFSCFGALCLGWKFLNSRANPRPTFIALTALMAESAGKRHCPRRYANSGKSPHYGALPEHSLMSIG